MKPDNDKLDIMMMLNVKNVSALKKAFEGVEEGLNREQFLYVMLKFLKTSSISKEDLVSHLSDLFDEIDINGDGTMEWDEFTSFVIDSTNGNSNETVAHILREATSSIYESPTEKKLKTIRTRITFLRFDEYRNRFLLVANEKFKLHLFNSQFHPLRSQTITDSRSGVIQMITVTKVDGYLVNLGSNKLLILDSTSLKTIKFMDLYADSVQKRVAYCAQTKTLFTTGMKGKIFAWDTSSATIYQMNKKLNTISQSVRSEVRELSNRKPVALIFCIGGVIKNENGNFFFSPNSHTDIVTSMVVAQDLGVLISGSLDKTIKIWDKSLGKFIKCLSGHRTGVVALCFCITRKLIASIEFSNEVFLWNPLLGSLVTRISVHSGQVVNIAFSFEEDFLLSGDKDGILKITELQQYQTKQSITLENDDLFTHMVPSEYGLEKRLFLGGRKLVQLRASKIPYPDRAHKDSITQIMFSVPLQVVVTCTAIEFRVWCYGTGELLATYNVFTERNVEITAVTMDDRERKIIIGTFEGELLVHDIKKLTLMKEISLKDLSENASYEIIMLKYAASEKWLLCCTRHGMVYIFDESMPDDIPLLKLISNCVGNSNEIVCCSACFNSQLMFCVDQKNHVYLWDLQFCSSKGKFRVENMPLIKYIHFSDTFSLLSLIHIGGKVTFWRGAFKNRKCLGVYNFELPQDSSHINVSVRKDWFILCYSGKVILFQVPSGLQLCLSDNKTLALPARTANSLSRIIKRDGGMVALNEKVCFLYVDVISQTQLNCKTPTISGISQVFLHPDGKTYFCGSFDGKVKVYDDENILIGELKKVSQPLAWNIRINVESRVRDQTERNRSLIHKANTEGVVSIDENLSTSSLSSFSTTSFSSITFARSKAKILPVTAELAGYGLSTSRKKRDILNKF